MLDFLSPPKIVSDARDALRLFILLSSEKNEPRSAATVIGFWGSSLWSPSGAVELALLKRSSPFFLLSPLRLHRPIKAESGALTCILTPSPCGHSPLLCNTREKVR